MLNTHTSQRKNAPGLRWGLAITLSGLLLAVTPLATASTSPHAGDEEDTQRASLMHNVEAFVIPDQVGPEDAWLHIDLVSRQLVLLRGARRLTTIPYVAYGSQGYRRVRVQGSRQTPVGQFTIQRINPHSKFRTFMEFDYPTPSTAWDARATGLLSDAEYRYYRYYRSEHGMSPPNTRLGGHIGLHGLGSSDEWIHKRRDWTQGCIAVTNEEIDQITGWIDIGSRVVIRG
ncbi:L,D-transpeptidase [Halomonas sp. M4R1S46]|uniref:L,D-transpeptidase n=1 Tax=Halomonas sp. M4R1S46 TaxID=2982692 RepID=UPI0021E4D209|nr:L,D-transpeptidase [Halomonas sp. M4R1S46]UYG08782.1 L,D-transpeptidase [Halomonas sp. M4R1S46]